MYIIAGSTGTLGTAIVNAMAKDNELFLIGKEVNDFHSLDKNMIFALHHSAIQELSKKIENNISYEDKKREYIKDIKKLDKLTQEMKKL